MSELDTRFLKAPPTLRKATGDMPDMSVRRKVTRTIRNEFDKSSIVSIYPLEIVERKETVYPKKYVIPAGSRKSPGILVVGMASWILGNFDDRPNLEVPVPSVSLADAVVRDWTNAMFKTNAKTSMPGLFVIPGREVTKAEVLEKYSDALDEAERKQNAYFMELVKAADSLWARSNNNPHSVSEEMRLAARVLKLEDKSWLKDYQTVEMKQCFACGTLKHPDFPICPNCKAVDTNHPKAADIKVASL